MYKFNFAGNDGRCYPNPGEIKKVKCGICGAEMNAKRNILGPTGFAEAMGQGKHLHDCFTCPNLMRVWHIEINCLKNKTYHRIINNIENSCGNLDYVKSKGFVEYEKKLLMKLNKKVKKILKTAGKKC